MADSSNVKVISDKMLEFMTVTSDQVIRGDIVHKVIDLTQRYPFNMAFKIIEKVVTPPGRVTWILFMVTVPGVCP